MGIKGVVYGKEYAAYLRLGSSLKGALFGSQSRTAYSHSGKERKTRLRVCIFDKSNKTFPKKFAISCRIRHSVRIRKKCLHT